MFGATVGNIKAPSHAVALGHPDYDGLTYSVEPQRKNQNTLETHECRHCKFSQPPPLPCAMPCLTLDNHFAWVCVILCGEQRQQQSVFFACAAHYLLTNHVRFSVICHLSSPTHEPPPLVTIAHMPEDARTKIQTRVHAAAPNKSGSLQHIYLNKYTIERISGSLTAV